MRKTAKKDFLKSARKSKGFTQKQIADMAGISRTTYTNIELGTARPSVKSAMSIAKVLEIDWTDFFEKKFEQDAL